MDSFYTATKPRSRGATWSIFAPALILTDVQRAARYLYLLKNGFAAVVNNLNYKVNVVQPPGFNPDRLPRIIEETHKRLARVQIEALPYEKVLKSFDRPATLFLPRSTVLRPQALQLQLRAG